MRIVTVLVCSILLACDARPSEEEAYFAAVRSFATRCDYKPLRTIVEYWEKKRGLRVVRPLSHALYGKGPLPLEPEHAPAKEALLACLREKGLVQMYAAGVLSIMRAPGHDDRLLSCARRYTTCMHAILNVADPEALSAMVPLIDSSDGNMMAYSLAELGAKGLPYLQQAIERGNTRGCVRALNAASVAFTPDIDDEMLGYGPRVTSDPQLLPRAREALRAGLANTHPECRIVAAKRIARFAPQDLIWITPHLADPDGGVRAAVKELVETSATAGEPRR